MDAVYSKRHGEAIISDSRRLRVLADVCNQVSGVVTAPVLRVDQSRGCIEYRRLDLSTPLTKCIGNQRIAGRLGQLLAAMHAANLTISEGEFSADPFPLRLLGLPQRDAAMLSEALPPGWFHSDFWHGNVFVMDDGNMAVIDPLPASFLFPDGYIVASGAVDVVTMYMSFVAIHPLLRQLTFPVEPRVDSADSFLEGYLRARGAYVVEVASAVRKTADLLACRWMNRSRGRLAWPVHLLKNIAFARVVRRLEETRRRRVCELVS